MGKEQLLRVRYDNGYYVVNYKPTNHDLVWFPSAEIKEDGTYENLRHRVEAPMFEVEFVYCLRYLYTWAVYKFNHPDVIVPLSPEIFTALEKWRIRTRS